MGLNPTPLPKLHNLPFIVLAMSSHHRPTPWSPTMILYKTKFSSQSGLTLSWAQPICFWCLNKSLLLYQPGLARSSLGKPNRTPKPSVALLHSLGLHGGSDDHRWLLGQSRNSEKKPIGSGGSLRWSLKCDPSTEYRTREWRNSALKSRPDSMPESLLQNESSFQPLSGLQMLTIKKKKKHYIVIPGNSAQFWLRWGMVTLEIIGFVHIRESYPLNAKTFEWYLWWHEVDM